MIENAERDGSITLYLDNIHPLLPFIDSRPRRMYSPTMAALGLTLNSPPHASQRNARFVPGFHSVAVRNDTPLPGMVGGRAK